MKEEEEEKETYKIGLSRTTALLALSLTFPLDHFFFLLQSRSAIVPKQNV